MAYRSEFDFEIHFSRPLKLGKKSDLNQKLNPLVFKQSKIGAIHNPGHVKPQTCQTPDTSNLRHIKPKTMNIGLPTTQQIKIHFHISIEILFENLKIN